MEEIMIVVIVMLTSTVPEEFSLPDHFLQLLYDRIILDNDQWK
jgi:hypothetical protein